MIPMFTFAGVIVDLSRMSSAQIVLSGASDLCYECGDVGL